MKKKEKHILVPFSSGLDSTYLVYKNLKEGNKVDVVYFTITNNTSKVKIEKIHRKKLIDLFRAEFEYNKINDSYKNFEFGVSGRGNMDMVQPIIWMIGLMTCVEEHYDEVQMAYVCNDDAISFIEEIKNLYHSYQPFMGCKLPKLTFPLKQLKKQQISSNLPSKYKEYVWSCEEPNIMIDIDKNVEGDAKSLEKNTVFIGKRELLEYKECGYCDACQRKKNLHIDMGDVTYKFENNEITISHDLISEKIPQELIASFNEDFEKGEKLEPKELKEEVKSSSNKKNLVNKKKR